MCVACLCSACAHVHADAHPETRKEHWTFYSTTLCFIPLNQGLSLQQEVGSQPASPIILLAPLPHFPRAEVTVMHGCTWLFIRVKEIWTQCSHLNCCYSLSHHLSQITNIDFFLWKASICITCWHLASFAVWWLYRSLFQFITCHTITEARLSFPTPEKFLLKRAFIHTSNITSWEGYT